MTSPHTLLVVDDDPNILEVLDARFTAAGYTVLRASDASQALDILGSMAIDLVISDIKMPNMSGIELFARLQQSNPGIPVIFLTAYGSIPEAVAAVQSGAIDYLSKPFDGKILVQKVRDCLDQLPGKKQSAGSLPSLVDNGFIWGQSKSMQELRDKVQRVAASNVNTLLLGESGVGKEGVAKAIHDNSPRSKGPYVIVDCGSTPAGILESELFGHTKGSFTSAVQDKKGLIEAANSGTLFLDEIGNISPEMQNRLLRFLEDKKIRRVGSLQEKQIDCRIIAATNADLTADIEAGTFRQDLYFRLRVITLTIPPLRERKEDIPELTRYFVQQHCRNYSLTNVTIPDNTMEWLINYNWPGNVRELRNALEGAVVLCSDNRLQPEDLQLEQQAAPGLHSTDSKPNGFSLEDSEKEAIIRALKETGGVLTNAAELLNISRRSIHYKLKKYNIKPAEFK